MSFIIGLSNIDNIEIIVKLLKENNIKDLVISPGGTNIPIIKAVQDDAFFNCYLAFFYDMNSLCIRRNISFTGDFVCDAHSDK